MNTEVIQYIRDRKKKILLNDCFRTKKDGKKIQKHFTFPPIGCLYATKDENNVVVIGFSILNKKDTKEYVLNHSKQKCECDKTCKKNSKANYITFRKKTGLEISSKRAFAFANNLEYIANIKSPHGGEGFPPNKYFMASYLHRKKLAEEQQKIMLKAGGDVEDISFPDFSATVISKSVWDDLLPFISRCKKVFKGDKFAPWIEKIYEEHIECKN